MLVGWGGNNGSTLTAGLIANQKKIEFQTRQGKKKANFFGSLTQSVTARVGVKYDKSTKKIKDVHRIVKDIVPLADVNNLEISGWDISGLNIYESCLRAQVLEPSLLD